MLDGVVSGGNALLTDGIGAELFELVGAEGARGTTGDAEASGSDTTGKEAHAFALPGNKNNPSKSESRKPKSDQASGNSSNFGF